MLPLIFDAPFATFTLRPYGEPPYSVVYVPNTSLICAISFDVYFAFCLTTSNLAFDLPDSTDFLKFANVSSIFSV